jgi:small subunit ribosomal protein S6
MENLYCTIFIVDISQNPEEVDTVSSRIQQLIEDHGGIIKRVNPWGKQKLAYPIHNRSYGCYVEIEFTANSRLNIPNTIEQEYRINDRVLRHLTYVVSKKELLQREINAARMKERAPQAPPREEKPQPAEAKVEDEPEDLPEKVVEKAEEKAPDTEVEQPAIVKESVEEPVEESVEEPAEEKVVDERAEASEDEKEKVEVTDDKKE